MYMNSFIAEVIETIKAFDFDWCEHVNTVHCFDVTHPRSNSCDPLCLVAEITKIAVEYDCRGFNYDGRTFVIIIENKTFKFSFVNGWAND